MSRIRLILLMFAALSLEAKHLKLNIHDALQQKKAKAVVKSLGGHQGFCLTLTVQNLSGDSLMLLVEAGRTFMAGDPGEQDILIVREEMIVLRKSESRSVDLKGYCCQASDRSPAMGAKYSVGSLADAALCALAQRLNARPFDRDIEQQAIWALSDHKATSSIPMGEDSCAADLRRLVAFLKNEPVPWYSVCVISTVFRNGIILQQPTYVSGTLKYDNAENCYGTFSVFDTSGLNVALVRCEWLKQGADQDYQFSVPVTGLRKGRYYVQISRPGATLVRKEFDI